MLTLYTHFWLRQSGNKSFHAFPNLNLNTTSLCGESSIIEHEMDLPTHRSPCCNHCFYNLYKIELRADKNEFKK